MKDITNNLTQELKKFWTWSGMTAEQYANDRGYGEWELEYPHWTNLGTCFYNAIVYYKNGNYSEVLVNLMLDAIAIDNEVESFLLDCETELDDKELEYIIECSINHNQSEARWQIASLIGKKHKKEWEKYLLKFVIDSNKYVQRRALLSLANINPNEAARIALEKISDTDEYMRLASLDVLQDTSFDSLGEVIGLLINDKSSIIQERIEKIRKELGNRT